MLLECIRNDNSRYYLFLGLPTHGPLDLPTLVLRVGREKDDFWEIHDPGVVDSDTESVESFLARLHCHNEVVFETKFTVHKVRTEIVVERACFRLHWRGWDCCKSVRVSRGGRSKMTSPGKGGREGGKQKR